MNNSDNLALDPVMNAIRGYSKVLTYLDRAMHRLVQPWLNTSRQLIRNFMNFPLTFYDIPGDPTTSNSSTGRLRREVLVRRRLRNLPPSQFELQFPGQTPSVSHILDRRSNRQLYWHQRASDMSIMNDIYAHGGVSPANQINAAGMRRLAQRPFRQRLEDPERALF